MVGVGLMRGVFTAESRSWQVGAAHEQVRGEASETQHGFFSAIEKLLAGSESTATQGSLLQAAEPEATVKSLLN